MKQTFFVFFIMCFSSANYADAVLVYERGFKASNVIINKIGVYSDLTDIDAITATEYRRQNSDALPPVVIAVGARAFRSVCKAHSGKKIVAVFIGQEEFLSESQTCVSSTTAVFSGADLSLRLRLFKHILPNISRLGLIYSESVRLNEAYYQAQAALYDLRFVFSSVPNDRNAIIKTINRILVDTDVLFSIIDTDLYQHQTIQDVLKLFFRQRKIMIGPSNNFVKAGALFSIYSDAEEQIKELTNILVQYDQDVHQNIPALYPRNLKIIFNPYLVRSFGIVLPSSEYLENTFGLCAESGCAKTLNK
ncbi:ABC transporter substrate-binding protein [Marinomonas sp. 2405UD68-3]|uniref:ABC transporter substrate-binding protein n=1 Tax=Marinomonas sp. 2405UD68-3 TaxID=3391835 RepID=UPI0039C9F0C5